MTTKKQTCRWAGLSLSNIASVFFPDLLQRQESRFNHELVAVSTTGSVERAKKWFQDNKIPNGDSVVIFNSWKEMLETGDFDVVYISTPHPLHYQQILKALESKRNVLVEKPATMNAAQYQRCCEMARSQGVTLMEAMWTRYLPATEYFKNDLIPKIGQIRRVYADFSFPIYSPDMPNSSRFLDKEAGAGSLLDQGVYALTWVDMALNSQNQNPTDTKVTYASSIALPGVPGDVDDMNTVILSNTNATAIVTTSMSLAGSSRVPFYLRLKALKAAPSVRVEATKGMIAIPFPPIRPEELHVQWYGDDFLDENGIEKNEVIKREASGWGIWYQADVIATAIFQGNLGTIGEDESLRVLHWMDEARRQAGITYDDIHEKV